MTQFDANYTRLKTMLILVLIIFFIYASEVVILGTGSDKLDAITSPFMDESGLESNENIPEPPPLNIISGIGASFSYIGGLFVLVFQILTFTMPSIPFWMTAIMLPVMLVLIAIAIYLFVDVIYAIVKALPLT